MATSLHEYFITSCRIGMQTLCDHLCTTAATSHFSKDSPRTIPFLEYIAIEQITALTTNPKKCQCARKPNVKLVKNRVSAHLEQLPSVQILFSLLEYIIMQ